MDEIFLLSYLRGECNDEEAGRWKPGARKRRRTGKFWEQLYYTLFVGDRVAMMNAVGTEASLDKFKSAVREKEKKAKRKNMSIRWGRYSTVAAAFLAGLVFLQAGLLGGWYLINFRTMRVLTVAGQRAQTVLPDGSKVWLNASFKIGLS